VLLVRVEMPHKRSIGRVRFLVLVPLAAKLQLRA
jgi:hypothetical protein